jgi:Na+/glutamate symporter
LLITKKKLSFASNRIIQISNTIRFMKKKKLSELTITELNKQKRFLTGVVLGSSIVMLALCCALLYLINKKQNFALVAVIPCFLVSMSPGVIRLNQINAEIKSRDSAITNTP